MGREEPPGRCFPARCGAAWGGYGAAWAAAVPRAGNTACRFSPATRHATCFFPVPPATPGRATPSPANRFSRITRHESRITAFSEYGLYGRSVLRGCARGGVTRNRRPDHCPHRQVTVFQFTIVHHCSLLFAIVRHCSPKILSCASLHFSPRGETKCVRGPSGLGASCLARAGVLEQYVEHGKQAQRSPGGRMACFGRRVVRNAG